ncbi:MAG TPA: tetratricopeptide repeat protein [Tepidisphaeraceae bacterium]|nr:tetratricopeptide repeat protein [Tepidisphaeraceae bacterium]
MQNAGKRTPEYQGRGKMGRPGISRRVRSFVATGLSFLFLAACGHTATQQDKIDAAAVAIGSQTRYDDAVADADDAIKMGPPNAEAYYYRGRAEQERPKSDPSIAQSDYDRAAADYKAALALDPDPDLVLRIHEKMADLAYSQEQYASALAQYQAVIDHLDSADVRAQALYQMGVCQQRIGDFDAADKTFAEVIQDYPDTDLAQAAHAHLGARAFYVELGEYADPGDSANALTQANVLGIKTEVEVRSDGMHILQSGPFKSYADAARVRNSVIVQFPSATVMP